MAAVRGLIPASVRAGLPGSEGIHSGTPAVGMQWRGWFLSRRPCPARLGAAHGANLFVAGGGPAGPDGGDQLPIWRFDAGDLEDGGLRQGANPLAPDRSLRGCCLADDRASPGSFPAHGHKRYAPFVSPNRYEK